MSQSVSTLLRIPRLASNLGSNTKSEGNDQSILKDDSICSTFVAVVSAMA
jgi:hypothetical protein